MKKILFIFLLCISFSCFGQDSLVIKYNTNTAELPGESTVLIKDFIKDKDAERIILNAYFETDDNPSKNRLLSELRLHNLREAILNAGVPFNVISTTIEQQDSNSQNVDLRLIAFFANTKTYGVLKKTPVVQISEFDFGYHKKTSTLVKKDTVVPKEISKEETEKEIVLDPAAFKKDATVSLPNLIFQGSTHYFLAISERVLRALLKVMKTRTDIEIELQGHVCCNPPGVDAFDIGTGEKNLSVMRAKAVYDYLIQGGIPATRMTYRGFGSSKRLYPDEKNSNEKMLNRRVEVLITASD